MCTSPLDTKFAIPAQGRRAIQISGGSCRAPNKPKCKSRNIGKTLNQISPTKRALPNALNFTDWRLSQMGRPPPAPGDVGTEGDAYIRSGQVWGHTPEQRVACNMRIYANNPHKVLNDLLLFVVTICCKSIF